MAKPTLEQRVRKAWEGRCPAMTAGQLLVGALTDREYRAWTHANADLDVDGKTRAQRLAAIKRIDIRFARRHDQTKSKKGQSRG